MPTKNLTGRGKYIFFFLFFCSKTVEIIYEMPLQFIGTYSYNLLDRVALNGTELVFLV